MKLACVVSLLLLGAASTPPVPLPRTPERTASWAAVGGIVFDSVSGKPLAKVRLVAHAWGIRTVNSFATFDSAIATSDSAGQFAFPRLRPDSYTVWVRPELGWCARRIHFVAADTGTVFLRVGLRALVSEGDYAHC